MVQLKIDKVVEVPVTEAQSDSDDIIDEEATDTCRVMHTDTLHQCVYWYCGCIIMGAPRREQCREVAASRY